MYLIYTFVMNYNRLKHYSHANQKNLYYDIIILKSRFVNPYTQTHSRIDVVFFAASFKFNFRSSGTNPLLLVPEQDENLLKLN
jgi:hypothetical protein